MQCFVKVFDQNQKHMEAWNQRAGTSADLTAATRGVIEEISKFLQYPQKPPVLESIFKKVADL